MGELESIYRWQKTLALRFSASSSHSESTNEALQTLFELESSGCISDGSPKDTPSSEMDNVSVDLLGAARAVRTKVHLNVSCL